jgi:transposase
MLVLFVAIVVGGRIGFASMVAFVLRQGAGAPDYHVEIYSVPSRLIREELEARITDRTIEILHKGIRVASHARSSVPHRHTTIPEHMPSVHRRCAEWTPARIKREAANIGPATIALVEAIMKAKPHPEQRFRACLSILRLARSYGSARRLPARQRHRRDHLRLDQASSHSYPLPDLR